MSSGRIRTQGLTEGAILAALVAIFAVAGRYIPLMSLATTFLCPLPLAVLVIRHGFKLAGIAGITSAVVGGVLAGPIVGLAILVSFAPMGLVIGLGVRQGWSASRIVGTGALVASVSTALSFLGLIGGSRVSVDQMAQTIERSVAMSADLAARIGIPPALVYGAGLRIPPIAETLRERFDPTREFALLLSYLLPIMFVSTSATMSWLNYEVGRRVLGRFRYHLPALPPIRSWRLPAAGVWLVPAGVLLQFAGSWLIVPVLTSVGLSLVLGAMLVFTLQGLVVGWVVLENYGFGKFERILAVWLAVAVPVFTIPLFILGMLDTTLLVRDRWGVESPKPRSVGAKP
ncbi:MAG: YybS family protein [Armatimonadota bacterium]